METINELDNIIQSENKYIQQGENENENEIESIKTWDELDLKEDILRGIYRNGFENPTPIQSKAIKPIVQGRDIIAQAQSGTGKTGAFTIASLQVANIKEKTSQVLIISPTRELVKQTCNVIEKIGDSCQGLLIKLLVGGTSVNEDINYLKKNKPHIVIGTSGRIYDMIRRKHFDTNYIKLIVLDEADEMLSKGFKLQIYDIFQYLPTSMRIALFSATIPYDVINLTKKIMTNPISITLRPEQLTLECIQQYYIALQNDSHKYETIKDLFSSIEVKQSIIYVNTIKRVNDLYDAMTKEGYPVCCIHSSMEKSQREDSLKQFRNGEFRILISSGITARGIDIQQVSVVINFDITKDVNTYLHAIGRSGRYGRKGLAINFVTRSDIDIMRRIEKHYKIEIKELPLNFNELI